MKMSIEIDKAGKTNRFQADPLYRLHQDLVYEYFLLMTYIKYVTILQ